MPHFVRLGGVKPGQLNRHVREQRRFVRAIPSLALRGPMRFRVIALVTVLLYLGPFVLAQDAQKEPAPDNTASSEQKVSVPDISPHTTDSNAPKDASSPAPAANGASPAAQG